MNRGPLLSHIKERWDAFGTGLAAAFRPDAAPGGAESDIDVAAFMPKREQLNRHMQVRLRTIGENAQPAFPTPEQALQVFATTQARRPYCRISGDRRLNFDSTCMRAFRLDEEICSDGRCQ